MERYKQAEKFDKAIGAVLQREPIFSDYGKIEETIITTLDHGKLLDIHRIVASEAFDLPVEEVTPEMRSRAKNFMFRYLYGYCDHNCESQDFLRDEESLRNFIRKFKDTKADISKEGV